MKDIIIVGAGIAGLSAGIYACQSGFNVKIYESHSIPGGASTSWRRKGYLFEGGMHWLTGSSSKLALNKCWNEVNALNDNVKIHNKDIFLSVEHEGKVVNLYTDIVKLEKHLLEVAPEDEKEIRKLIKDLKSFANFEMPIKDIKGVKVKYKTPTSIYKGLSMLPLLPKMNFYMNQTVKEYAERFTNPLLILLIKNIVLEEFKAISLIATLATVTSGDGGYPEGGSLGMANRMANYLKKLGGKIEYGKKVSKVIIKNDAACGVVIEDEEVKADSVIVTSDTVVAIDKLFDEPISEPWAEVMRKNTRPLLNTFICLGIEEELSSIGENILFPLEEPFFYANNEIKEIVIHNYYGYKGYAPKGSTAVTSIIMGDSYDFWKEARRKGTYEEEKEKLANQYIKVLSKKYPQIKGKVVVWDVATPLTYERYLGSYKGSWMSLMGKKDKMESYPLKPETINNLYFAGQRMTVPGGLPVALETGRKAVQYLCKDKDMVFQGNM